MNSVKDIF